MKHHKHGLRIGDEIQLQYSARNLYQDFPVTYSYIDCKDLRGLITYRVIKVGKCVNLITINSPISNQNISISTAFIRPEFLLK